MDAMKLGLIIWAVLGVIGPLVAGEELPKKPSVKDVEAKAGFNLSAPERDAAWEQITADPVAAQARGLQAFEASGDMVSVIEAAMIDTGDGEGSVGSLVSGWVSVKTKGVEVRTRAGMRWARKPKRVDLGGFTSAQVRALKSDPYLTITKAEAPVE